MNYTESGSEYLSSVGLNLKTLVSSLYTRTEPAVLSKLPPNNAVSVFLSRENKEL